MANTEKFNQWFKKSVVADKDKTPLTVYHGTTQDITIFNTEPQNRSFNGMGETAIGCHFTEDRTIAECYPYHAKTGEVKRVMEVNLSIQNPKKYRTLKSLRDDLLAFCEEHQLSLMPRDRLNNVALFKKTLIEKGFDGITYLEGPPYNVRQSKKRVWVAFNPNQIKSIHSRNFDPNSPDINE